MISQLRPAIVSTVLLTALLGLGYPLAVTGVAQAAFPAQANGSLLKGPSGAVIGSSLIGQPFAKPEYLHPRPSAAGKGYDASASSGSNYGPLNPDLAAREKTDADALRAEGIAKVPADAVTTSGSGLDPHISPAYARAQVARVALARGLSAPAVQAIIDRRTEGPVLGFLGQPRVNVLLVNRDLDEQARAAHSPPA